MLEFLPTGVPAAGALPRRFHQPPDIFQCFGGA